MTSAASPELAPAGPRRKQRGIQLPQLLLSLLVVAVFALLAVWWQASSTARTPVVALAADVQEGQEIDLEDLTEIFISSDVPARTTDSSRIEEFVDARPVTDLSAGTILTTDLFVGGSDLLEGQAFAGLIVDGTRAPRGLVAGDRVQVLLPSSGDGGVDIVSENALVELARPVGDQVQVRLRLDLRSAQRVQLRSRDVVLIEIPDEPAFWESEEPGS